MLLFHFHVMVVETVHNIQNYKIPKTWDTNTSDTTSNFKGPVPVHTGGKKKESYLPARLSCALSIPIWAYYWHWVACRRTWTQLAPQIFLPFIHKPLTGQAATRSGLKCLWRPGRPGWSMGRASDWDAEVFRIKSQPTHQVCFWAVTQC